MPRSRVWLCNMLLLVALIPAESAQDPPLAGLDDHITKTMQDWEVPGLALAVVKNDAIVLARGYGVRKLGETVPVNEKTLFAIGSASKAFTAALIAMLVDDGKIKWDDPVTKYLGGFQLYDPYVTRELTVRDLLCHRCGLDRGDLLWYGSAYSRDEVLQRIRYLKPGSSFRSKFGYQNIMFLAAGQILPSVVKKSWDEFVKERIFTPLGMTASNTSTLALSGQENVATPHDKVEDKLEPIPWRNIDNVGPAGSINSNVVDMAQWVRLQLGEGTYNKQRLLSSGAIKEMHTPQTIMRLEGTAAKLNPETHLMAYGLGWVLQDYRGKKIVQHGGNIDGMSALVAMIPEEKLGLVILTNRNATALPTALMYRIFDAYLQAPAKDWSAELLKVSKAAQDLAKQTEKKKESERVKDTKPSLALEKYAGTYKDDMHGDLKVAHANGKLTVQFNPSFTGELEHWHYDTFRLIPSDRRQSKVFMTYTLGGDGKANEIHIDAGAAGELVFKRAPEPVKADAAISLSEEELKKFLGVYELKTPPVEISIEMVGGKLKGVLPGQPTVSLVPVAPTRLQVEGVPIKVFLDFELVDGKVKSMTLEQGSNPKLTFAPKGAAK